MTASMRARVFGDEREEGTEMLQVAIALACAALMGAVIVGFATGAFSDGLEQVLGNTSRVFDREVEGEAAVQPASDTSGQISSIMAEISQLKAACEGIDGKADAGHAHALDSESITGALPLSKGGTGSALGNGSAGEVLASNADGTVSWAADADTKNTAGATGSASKLYLIGAAQQAESAQTFTSAGAYVSGGALFAGADAALSLSNNALSGTRLLTLGSADGGAQLIMDNNELQAIDPSSGSGAGATLYLQSSGGAIMFGDHGSIESVTTLWDGSASTGTHSLAVPALSAADFSYLDIYYNAGGELASQSIDLDHAASKSQGYWTAALSLSKNVAGGVMITYAADLKISSAGTFSFTYNNTYRSDASTAVASDEVTVMKIEARSDAPYAGTYTWSRIS